MNFALLLEILRRHGITNFEKGRSYSVTLTKEEAIKILGEAPRHAVFRVQTLFIFVIVAFYFEPKSKKGEKS